MVGGNVAAPSLRLQRHLQRWHLELGASWAVSKKRDVELQQFQPDMYPILTRTRHTSENKPPVLQKRRGGQRMLRGGCGAEGYRYRHDGIRNRTGNEGQASFCQCQLFDTSTDKTTHQPVQILNRSLAGRTCYSSRPQRTVLGGGNSPAGGWTTSAPRNSELGLPLHEFITLLFLLLLNG